MGNSKKILCLVVFSMFFLILFAGLQNFYLKNDKNTSILAADSASVYEVEANVEPCEGQSPGEIVDGPGTYEEGDEVTVRVEPDNEYVEFGNWTSDSDEVVFADPEAEETTFTMPAEDVWVTANFDEDHKYHFVVPWGYDIQEGFPVSVVYGWGEFEDSEIVEEMLQLNGAASIVEDEGYGASSFVLQLTSSDNEGGSAFTKNKIHLGDDYSFSTFFRFRLRDPIQSAQGGEGFTFTLQAQGSDAFVNDASSMGTKDINPSVSIGFDTLIQDEQREQLNLTGELANLITVFINGNDELPVAVKEIRPIDYDSSADYVWIDYDGSSDTMEIYLADTPGNRPGYNFSGELKIENLDLESVFITDEGEPIKDVYVGFTANTCSGAQQQHNIELWAFKNDSEPMYYYDYIYEEASIVSISDNLQPGEAGTTVTASVYNKYHEPVADIPVDFSISSGLLNSTSVITDVYGKASVTINSEISETALLRAVARGGAFAEAEVQLSNPEGDVAADKEWLTDELLLDGNSADNVIDDLNMPEEGENGSSISWESSDDTVVALDGTLSRPSYTEGDKQIILRAVISKGDVEAEKTFITLTVKALQATDEEVLAADMEWFIASETLDDILDNNSSQYSIKSDLVLPASAPSGSTINWESSNPGVISNDGEVIRPNVGENHQSVTMTAALKKGDVQDSRQIEYTVLAEEDNDPPEILNTIPANSSTDVIYDNRKITAYFNEDIEKGENWGEIKLGYFEMVRKSPSSWQQNFREVDNTVRIDDNKMIVTLGSDMKSLKNYQLIIPENTVEDLSGNKIQKEFTLDYKTEKIKTGDLQIIDSNPENREENVSADLMELSLWYSDDLESASEGSLFEDITLCSSSGEEILVSRKLDGNKVTLELDSETELQLGEVYEINIPAGAIEDRFKRSNIYETIKFKTRKEAIPPEVIKIYPGQDMNNVSVYQTVDIDFSEGVKADKSEIRLLDSEGNRVPSKIFLYNDNEKMVIDPVEGLEPETEYKVSLSENSIWDLHKNYINSGYEISFTTGTNSLEIQITNISHMEDDISMDNPVQIQFLSPVTRGPKFDDIKISDSQGNSVAFESKEVDNEVTLEPYANLRSSKTYTVEIPYGAYENKNNSAELNDAIRFKFTTAKALDTGSSSFAVEPVMFYVTGSELTFNAEELENKFERAGREITSYQWNFGDGNEQTGKTVEHTYTETGQRKVTLEIWDNKGIFYVYEESVILVESGDVEVSISPERHKHVFKSDAEAKNTITYSIEVSPRGVPEVGNVKVSLYKIYGDHLGGGRYSLRTFEDIEIPDTGRTDFKLNYNGLSIGGGVWSYELVFEYDAFGETRQVSRSFRIDDKYSAKLRFKLYDSKAGSYLYDLHNVKVKVDGEARTAEIRHWKEKDSYWYQLDVNSAGPHKVQVSIPNYYPSDKKDMYLSNGLSDTDLIEVEPMKDSDRPVLRYIKSAYTDSRDSSPSIFIKNSFAYTVGSLNFSVEGDWNGFESGYLELKTTSGRQILSKKMDGNSVNEDVFFLYYLEPGDGMKARMVSKNGTTSPWVDAKLVAAPEPDGMHSLFMGHGGYKTSQSILIDELVAGRVPVLEDIPMLNKSESFGLMARMIDLSGKRNLKDDTIGLSSKEYKSEFKSAGYTIGSTLSGGIAYKYNQSSNIWEVEQGEIKAIAAGGYEWQKDFDIPGIDKVPGIKKLDIGGYAKLIMQADVGGTFIITGSGEEYKGILYFAPDLELVLGAGHDAVNVEGYGGGRVDTEVHVPTGYVLVEPSLRTGIRVNAFGWTGDIYSAEAKTLWDNDKEKVDSILASNTLQPLMLALDKEDMQLEPMSRNYLARSSEWLGGVNKQLEEPLLAAGDLSPLVMGFGPAPVTAEGTNPRIDLMKNNIYPDAEVQLVRNGDELWMLWTDDNTERSDMNRTQMMYSVLKDDTWSNPEWIDEDGTADFRPVAASTGKGVLMAWQNIKETMPEDAEVITFMENAEISVTENVYQVDGSDVQIATLTNDDKFDHSPKLAAEGDNALLTWTKTDMEVSGDNDMLMFSDWNGINWSEPKEITDVPISVINSSLTMYGDKGLLLYTLDVSDGKREIFARVYDRDSWGEEVQITENTDGENLITKPQAVYKSGKWFITWYQGSGIMYKEGLSGEIRTEEFLKSVESNYQITKNNGEKSQIALVYQKRGTDTVQNLSTSFYDIEKGIWSDEISLTEEDGYIRSFSPLFTEDGKLNIAYTQAEIITEVIDGTEFEKPGNKVDLYTLTYTPVHDIALSEEDGLKLSPEIPVPGTIVTLSADVKNQGDFPENAVLYLYDGDPEDGGEEIGITRTEKSIPARSSAELEVEWLLDFEERDKYDIHAVVETDDGVAEIDESNNILNYEVITADIAVTGVEYENLGKDDYLAAAEIINIGGRSLEGIEVYLDNAKNEESLQTKNLEKLEPGQEVNISFLFSLDDLTEDENGEFNMSVTALPPDEVEEFNRDDNIYKFELKPASIAVDSMDPGEGETQVNIQKSLTLNFNMIIEEGENFNEIILVDDRLNSINISKEIKGETLIITPKNPMDYDTNYTLTVPQGALVNSYRHTMDGSYQLSFKTTTSSPEIIFNYPGNEMGNIALDTVIKLKFNQDILKGTIFDEIKLHGSPEIHASNFINGEWLYINPLEHLEENKIYTLSIPAGAVKNDRGEILQEDYTLKFETKEKDEKSETSNSSDKQDDYKISRLTFEDGRTTAAIYINRQSILKNGSDEKAVIINLTDEIAEDEIININLNAGVLEQFVLKQTDMKIVTGKGDLLIPAGVIEFLVQKGENSISITIAENNEMETGNDRVSDGIFDFSIMSGDESVTRFAEEVIVTLPLDMSKVGDPRRVIVCVYDEITGNWQVVGGAADVENGSITFETNHFSTYAAFETVKQFYDVKSDWAKEEVEILASRGLINGVGENTFNPGGSITRAEFTALIVRSLYTELIESRGTFTDVSKDVWFADMVETAYAMEIIKGTGQNTFEPNAQISREQLAAIAYRFYKYKTGDKISACSGNEFVDQQEISFWAKEAVNFAADAEIMIGSGGNFCPKRSTTRQEAAVVLYRLLEYMGEI